MIATNPKPVRWLLSTCFAVALVATAPAVGFAQDAASPTAELSASPEGMIGLGLIGAEIGMLVPAIAGVSDTWAYLVFPTIGAAGGAVAGIFLLQDGSPTPAGGVGSPELAVAAFAVGLTGLIPALVVTMAATAYDPEDDADLAQAAREAGPGLVRVSPKGTFVAAPGVQVRTTKADPLGVRDARRELSVSVVSGRF
ncbi:MAG: hypothetical protein OXU20_13965 [Myxococcales bacterium]|nr:hypothetical protein [Myxococcales bacterium]MDD9965821.1 hypothetical protein [Myxococcales bacterium]